jgi:hypothetical protein
MALQPLPSAPSAGLDAAGGGPAGGTGRYARLPAAASLSRLGRYEDSLAALMSVSRSHKLAAAVAALQRARLGGAAGHPFAARNSSALAAPAGRGAVARASLETGRRKGEDGGGREGGAAVAAEEGGEGGRRALAPFRALVEDTAAEFLEAQLHGA